MKRLCLIIILFTSFLPGLAINLAKPYSMSGFTYNSHQGRIMTAQFCHITPRYRQRSINYASEKYKTKIKKRPWDKSKNYCILATSGIYGMRPNITRALVEEEIKSIQLESKKTKKILCEPIASHSFRLTEEDVDYISMVYQYSNAFLAAVGLPVGINAVLNEYDYHCLEKEKKIRLRLNRKNLESATNSKFKKVRKYILKDMEGEE